MNFIRILNKRIVLHMVNVNDHGQLVATKTSGICKARPPPASPSSTYPRGARTEGYRRRGVFALRHRRQGEHTARGQQLRWRPKGELAAAAADAREG